MNNRDVVTHRQRLDNLFAKIAELNQDSELQSHWARYLCVLVSGFLETSLRSIYGKYARTKAAPNVANFVEKELDDFQNPKMGKILELAGAFSKEWEDKLREATEGPLKDAVDSIVANRHGIAHGENVGITYVRILEYYRNAVKVIELIERQCV